MSLADYDGTDLWTAPLKPGWDKTTENVHLRFAGSMLDEPYEDPYEDPNPYSTCIECGVSKLDPDEFYDGLRCIECCEKDDIEPCMYCGCPADEYDGHVCEDYE